MIRALGLAVVVGISLTVAAAVVLFIASSGNQFERRLVHHWKLGKLELVSTHMEDLNSVGFDAVRLHASPQVESPYLVQLDRVSWRRDRWIPNGAVVDDAEIVFGSGRIHLERQDGVGWNVEGISSGSPSTWLQQLPSKVVGTDVDLLLTRIAPRFRAGLQLRLEELEWRRQQRDGTLTAVLKSKSWGAGSLQWQYRSSAEDPKNELEVQLHDVELEELPLAEMGRLLPFPWPTGVPQPQGRADLSWILRQGVTEVQIEHYLARLQIPEWNNPLQYLRGRLALNSEAVSWKLEQGVYSQSSVAGHVEVDLAKRRVDGEVEVSRFLSDSELWRGLPEPWSQLTREFPLSGVGELKATLKGPLDGPWSGLVERLGLRLEGAALQGDEQRDALSGNWTLLPDESAWGVTGSTLSCLFRGFRLPKSVWKGSLSAQRLHLQRVIEERSSQSSERDRNEPNPLIELSLTADGEVLRLQLSLQELGLGHFLSQRLGSARGACFVEGEWRPGHAASWRATFSWNGMEIDDRIRWPVRRPEGKVRGTMLMRSEGGLISIPALWLEDLTGTWVARGEVRGDGMWSLTGKTHVGSPAWLTLERVPQLLDYSAEGWQPFQVVGSRFAWKERDQPRQ